MIVVPYVPAHFDGFEIQEGQYEMRDYITNDYADTLALIDSYTVLVNGVVVAIGGVARQGVNRALAWALIGKNANAAVMRGLSKIVRSRLACLPYQRVEAIVREGFLPGHRWLKMLGFSCETPFGMVNWFPNGQKAYLYARVQV